MAKRQADSSNESYHAFRDFLLDHADLVRDVLLQSHQVRTNTISNETNLIGSSVSALCDHCTCVFEELIEMKTSIRVEVLSFLRNVNKFKVVLTQFVQSIHDQEAAHNSLIVEVNVDESCHVHGEVISAEAGLHRITELGNSLCKFHIHIQCHNFAGDYTVKVDGCYLSYDIDDTINKKLKGQYELNFLHQRDSVDNLSLSTDRKVNEHMPKRVAVYDAVKYRRSQYTNVKRGSKKDSTKKILMSALRTNVLFSSYTEYEQKRIVDAFDQVEVKAGEVVIRQGERGDHFYVVESGRLQLFIENSDGEQILSTHNIDAGSSFGEIALLYDIPRTATVTAFEDSILWRVDRHTYRYVVSSTEKQSMEENMLFLEEVQIMGKKFKDMLNDNDLNLLVTAVEQEDFAPGEIIIRQDQPGDYFYIIKSGDVGVCKVEKIPGCDTPVLKALLLSSSTDSIDQLVSNNSISTVNGSLFNTRSLGLGPQIAVLHAGSYFGERALLSEDVRQASCVALNSVSCLSLSREMFTKLVGTWHDLEVEAAPSAPTPMFKRVSSAMSAPSGAESVDGCADNRMTADPGLVNSIDDMDGNGNGSGNGVAPVQASASLARASSQQSQASTGSSLTGSGPSTPVRASSVVSNLGSQNPLVDPTALPSNTEPLGKRTSSRSSELEVTSGLAAFVFSNNSTSTRGRSVSDFTNATVGSSSGSEAGDSGQHSDHDIGSLNDIEQLFTLGTGAFGRVRLAKNNATGRFVVVKIQGKKAIQDQAMEAAISNEIILMRRVRSPFVAKLYTAFQDDYAVHMVMEFLPCGDFFAFLQSQGKNKLTEDKARFYSANVIAGLDALHSHSIAYRDLKPENLVRVRFDLITCRDVNDDCCHVSR
jgi:cAMP-dependent protein kinase regulator